MRLFRFLRRKSDLTEEMESHLKMAIADRVARGQSPADARTSAMRDFGNVPMIADVTRDQWGWLRLELLIQDVALRPAAIAQVARLYVYRRASRWRSASAPTQPFSRSSKASCLRSLPGD